MKKLRFGFRALLKCLGMALLAGLPLLPALAQSLAIVANPGDNNVMLIDTSRTPFAVVATIPTTGPSAPCCSSSPEWVALTPGGRYAWVTNLGGNDNLVVIDMSNQIPVVVVKAETLTPPPSCGIGVNTQCRAPQGIAINPCPALVQPHTPCAARNGDNSASIYAYVSNPAVDNPNGTIASVTVIDVNAALINPSSSIVSTVMLPDGSKPHHLSVSPDGSTLFVADNSGLVWLIDTSCAVTSSCPAVRNSFIFGFPTGGLFGVAAADAEHVWVTVDQDCPAGAVVLLSLVGIAELSRSDVSACNPQDIALSPGGRDAWAAFSRVVSCVSSGARRGIGGSPRN